MSYKSVMVTRLGGPEVLQVVEHELHPPAAGEARIRVLAASVCRPDVTTRRGEALYSGTPLGKKPPFTPGYAIIGVVDAVGPGVEGLRLGQRVGAMTVFGGYSETVYWPAGLLIPVPAAVDPGEAVTLVLNYLVAYQALFRAGKAKAGEVLLIIGASGGIGTALLELGRLAGLKMYGVASRAKHGLLTGYGAAAVDYHTQDFVSVVGQAEPGGIDLVMDGMMRPDTIRRGLGLLRRGGRLVAFGEPAGLPVLLRILGQVLAANLAPNGKHCRLYGTSSYSLGHRKPYIEDWAILFRWLEEGKLKPVIERRFPLLQAAQANALLESGQVCGNVVLEVKT